MPAHQPAKPVAEIMAFDSVRGVTVMFNPEDVPNLDERQTLEWDGSDWMLRAMDGPQWREGASMVFDSERRVCMLFGGRRPGFNAAETWEWNGNAWAQLFPAQNPKKRHHHSMAFDARRGVVVMFGGFDDNDDPYGDTWEWDGSTWINVATEGPGASAYNAMAYDATRGVTVLVSTKGDGGKTWEWDGKVWTFRTDQGPGHIVAGAMIYDSNRGTCILYGGYCQFCQNTPSDETWQWDGQAWTKLDTPNNPGRRAEHVMAYDSARNAIVLFGGVDGADRVLDDTWEFTCGVPCYPDLNGDGTLDLFDFLAFVNSFNAGEGNTTDCDQSGSLDLFDFLCFVNQFNAGC